MNCKECQNLITVRIYGGLEPVEENALRAHVRDCGECGRMFSRFENHNAVLEGTEPEVLPDWDESWQTIREEAFPKSSKRRFRWVIPRPVMAAATLVMVFILGALVGRKLILRAPDAAAPVMQAASTSGAALVRYADDLGPILTGFMNRTAEAEVAEASRIARIERLLIQDMLIQTRLLKHLMGQTDDPSLLVLLDDLELILVGMANLQSGDQESLSHLQGIIREKDLKFKLKAFTRSEAIF